MGELFQRDKSTISRHIKNIFSEDELVRDSVVANFATTAADMLFSLQVMQDFGVNLVCVEDGIDSSKDAGKLMISVLSAVAEIEREIFVSKRWKAASRTQEKVAGTVALLPMGISCWMGN